MGTGSTKILPYDEASKRCKYSKILLRKKVNKWFFYLVLPADLERIETTFRDLTNGNGELSYTNFKRDVFAHFLPEKLATVCYFSFSWQFLIFTSYSATLSSMYKFIKILYVIERSCLLFGINLLWFNKRTNAT